MSRTGRQSLFALKGGGRGMAGRALRLLDLLRPGAMGLLLLSVGVSVVAAGSGMGLFATMLVAWSLFPVLVGLRNVLEAGCAFMLISVGILVVIGAAQHGPGNLLP